MSVPGSAPSSPQSAMRRSKEELTLPPSDPHAPQKIGILVHSYRNLIISYSICIR
jgi:hypothetical protein